MPQKPDSTPPGNILAARIAGPSRHSIAALAVVAGSLCAQGTAQELPQKLAQNTPPPAFRTADAPVKPNDEIPPAQAEKPADANPPAHSQTAPPPPGPAPEPGPAELMGGNAGPSPAFAINLLKLMVKKGMISEEEAKELIKEAENDTALAQQQTLAVAQTTASLLFEDAAKKGLIPANPGADDTVRVTYVPEIVKKQIRDELRADIAQQAKDEKWAGAVKIPDWVTKFRVKGDVRLRYEGNYFPSGNDNTGAFPNFNSINTGSPFDVSGTVFSPQLNTDEDRQRYRLRARLGAEVDMGDGFTAGLRVATGQDNSPTSPNQSFGIANNASGGNFSKYAIWLDRAFIKYESMNDTTHLTATGGRFDNPFFSTDMIYDEDLGFDGLAVTAKHKMGKVTPFITAGAFPIFNTDFNFSSNQPSKFNSTDKYLYGAQLGAEAKVNERMNLKMAVAYYDFDGVRGEQSTPYTPLTASDAGDTDGTRPSYAQKGNTYIPLRRIIPNANNNFGTSSQFQYFGLGTKFQPLAVTGKLEYNGFEPVQVVLTGEYIRNLGFDRDRLNALGVNNRAPRSVGGTPGAYAGGDTAWMLGLRAGKAALQQRGDWQAGVYYKHIESDAVVDGFTDSDFGLGGTNMKGFGIFGTWALSPNTAFGVRWISTTEIAGPPLRNDTLQLDFTGKF
jgi:Putative porin